MRLIEWCSGIVAKPANAKESLIITVLKHPNDGSWPTPALRHNGGRGAGSCPKLDIR